MNIRIDRIAVFGQLASLLGYRAAVATNRVIAPSTLTKGQTLCMGCAFGSSIECQVGKLWITHDGDPKGIALEPGQRYVVDRGRRCWCMP